MFTFIKKIFFFISFVLLISSNSNSAESNAEAFVLKLTNEAKIIFNDKSLNKDSRLKKLNDLSSKYLDLDALAGYTLGDYREKATTSERENFNKLFREYFIKNIRQLVFRCKENEWHFWKEFLNILSHCEPAF